MDPLIGLLAALLVAAFLGEIAHHLKVPRVIGHIAAGLVLGIPAVKVLVFDGESVTLLSYLAQIGVILLLFFTGLEVNFRSFVRNIRVASGISFANTTLALVAGYLVSRYVFGLSGEVSFIVGVCLSVTAAALALDLLEEFRLLKSRFGTLVVSASAVDDVYELGIIAVAVSFITAVVAKDALVTVFLDAALFVVLVGLFRLLIIPFILRFIEHGTAASLVTSGIIITLLLATLSNILGLGAFIGALISGMLVRQALLSDVKHHRPWEANSISHSIHTVAFGFFVPLFFVHVGLLTDVTAIWENVVFGVVITVIAIVGTVVGSALGYIAQGGKWREGWLLGWALNAKGDTEMVIATLALESGIISSQIFSSLIFMAVVSTMVSPLVFRSLLRRQKLR